MKISILHQKSITPGIEQEISELFKELSANKRQIELDKILRKENQITFAYCEANGKIVGIASMCTYQVISGNKGWIEDVVVHTGTRGKGIGRSLIEKLIGVAKEKNVSEMLLFTEDHRIPAINLYSKLGFKPSNSRIYSLKDLQKIK
jgi:phosphinothricin acetyltransferase